MPRFCAFVFVCTVGAAIASQAGFAGRIWWFLDLASHFRVQYFWALAVAAVTLACCRHWRRAAVAAVFALLNLALVAPLYFNAGPPAATAGAKTRIRALSLNLFSGNRRHEVVRQFIREVRPDVAVFLELTDQWNDALSELHEDFPHRHLDPSLGNFGIALFSRIPFRDVQMDYLSNGDPAIVATFGENAVEWVLIGAHPFPPVGSNASALRNRQLQRLAEIAGSQQVPVVVLGDLNVTPWSPHFADLLATGRLRDSRRGFGVQPSWPAGNVLLRIPIDHCLVSSSVTIHDRKTGPDVGSDHLPVTVEFSVP